MRKSTFVLVILFFCQLANSLPAADIKADLLQILDLQKAAWNRQDIEGFMAYYWNSPEFTFQSGANRLRGWNALLERYKKSYSGDNWGVLDFTDLEVNVLSADSAYILGRWKLAIKENLKEGVFTIIFKRFPEGWRIVHDHSS
jgi:beta-aspartyl-peptidase (threonine type)